LRFLWLTSDLPLAFPFVFLRSLWLSFCLSIVVFVDFCSDEMRAPHGSALAVADYFPHYAFAGSIAFHLQKTLLLISIQRLDGVV